MRQGVDIFGIVEDIEEGGTGRGGEGTVLRVSSFLGCPLHVRIPGLEYPRRDLPRRPWLSGRAADEKTYHGPGAKLTGVGASTLGRAKIKRFMYLGPFPHVFAFFLAMVTMGRGHLT